VIAGRPLDRACAVSANPRGAAGTRWERLQPRRDLASCRGPRKPDQRVGTRCRTELQATCADTSKLADAAYDLILETGQAIHPIALSENGRDTPRLLFVHIGKS
jgi:hypothetical protein